MGQSIGYEKTIKKLENEINNLKRELKTMGDDLDTARYDKQRFEDALDEIRYIAMIK